MTVCLTRLKNKKLKIKNVFIENYKNMDEDFEPNYYSKSATSISRVEHESNRLMRTMVYYDNSYENIN